MARLLRETVIPRRQWPGSAILWVTVGSAATVLASGLWLMCTMSFEVIEDPPDWEVASATDVLPVMATDDAIGEPVDPGALEVERAPGARRGAATSAGPLGVTATWTDEEILASFDDGRSFEQVLAGPGKIHAAAVDARGWVYAIRGRSELGVAKGYRDDGWNELPYAAETLALAARGGWLGWLHLAPEPCDVEDSIHAMLAITIDGGNSWDRQVVPHWGNAGNDLRIEADGTIHLVTLDQKDAGTETVRRFRGHVDARPFDEIPWRAGSAGGFGLVEGGAVLAAGCGDDAASLCTLPAGGGAPAVHAGLTSELWLEVGANAVDAQVPRSFAATAGRLYAIEPGGAGDAGEIELVAGGRAPRYTHDVAVDDLGRAVVLAGDHLLRWSPRHGWRRLLTP